tara:strand:- start:15652 stop:16320 length:669 start_codon:yes stop_codon:yes gene_type:complete
MNCIILARGGSKGVPKKNIKILKGQPLIAYPIQTALQSQKISNVYVSTDCEEIADISKSLGAKIIERPDFLADDHSLDVDAFRHAVTTLNDYSDMVHLRATTPITEHQIVDSAIKLFELNPDCTALRSAHEFSESVYKFFRKNGDYWDGFFPHLKGEYYNLPRQNFEKSYLPNGYVDIVRPEVFMNSDSFHGKKILSFVTPYSIEVDTMEDFKMLEWISEND